MKKSSDSISPTLRKEVLTLTGHNFDLCKSQEELIRQLAKSVSVLKTRHYRLARRVRRTKKAYEFAQLEAKSWRKKAEA